MTVWRMRRAMRIWGCDIYTYGERRDDGTLCRFRDIYISPWSVKKRWHTRHSMARRWYEFMMNDIDKGMVGAMVQGKTRLCRINYKLISRILLGLHKEDMNSILISTTLEEWIWQSAPSSHAHRPAQ